jgi:hypothetical protein
MKTVLEIALSTKFNAEQIPALVDIISSTPNADVATEIILGIYKEPTVSEHSIINDKFCTFKSYNKWTNTVTYTYTTVRKVQIYVNKNVPESDITPENYLEHTVKEFGSNIEGKYVYITFPDKIDTITRDMSLHSWEEGASKVGQMQP